MPHASVKHFDIFCLQFLLLNDHKKIVCCYFECIHPPCPFDAPVEI